MVHIIRTAEAEKKGQLQRGWLFHRSEGLQEVQLECYQLNATLGNWLFAWCWDFPHLVKTSVNSWTSLAGWMANGHGNDNCTSWRINLWAKPASQSWNLEAWHLGEPSDSGTSWSTDPWQIAPVQTHHHHLEMDLHKIFRMQTEQVSVKAVNTILLLMRVGAWYSTRKIKITFQAKVQCAENRSSIPSIPMEASNIFMLGKSSWLDLKLKK